MTMWTFHWYGSSFSGMDGCMLIAGGKRHNYTRLLNEWAYTIGNQEKDDLESDIVRIVEAVECVGDSCN